MPQILKCDVDEKLIDPTLEYFTLSPSQDSVVLICSRICLLRHAQKLLNQANDEAQAALAEAQAIAAGTAAQAEEANEDVADVDAPTPPAVPSVHGKS